MKVFWSNSHLYQEAVQESLQQSIVSSSSAQVQPFRHRFVPPVEPSAEVHLRQGVLKLRIETLCIRLQQ